MEYQISDFDIFFISYDEPNAEKNWADLLTKAPWAKRVHGVKGFDSAHRACGEQSSTDRLFTVDGDTLVRSDFFQDSLTINDDQTEHVFSWSSVNAINSLAYGNGGVKLWPKHIIKNLASHEHSANEEEAVDFCWDLNYFQMNDCIGTTYPNASPFQAFRAGFREGVKMSLEMGHRVEAEEFRFKIFKGNLDRLLIWMSVGSDTDNGNWAIYGSRLGCYMTTLTDWEHHQIRDYDWFNDFWKEHENLTEEQIKYKISILGKDINFGLKISTVELGIDESKFFKSVWQNPDRKGLMFKEHE